MQTSEVLNRAADLIEERGWYSVGGQRSTPWQADCWGRLDSEDAFCLEGGIAAALGIRETPGLSGRPEVRECPPYRAIQAYLGRMPMAWNDAADRTASEVIEVLRACAVIEASREHESAEVSASTSTTTSPG